MPGFPSIDDPAGDSGMGVQEEFRGHLPDALIEFAKDVIRQSWNGSLDEPYVQELGVKLGLLKKVAFEPAIHDDVNAYDVEAGDPWYVFDGPLLARLSRSTSTYAGRLPFIIQYRRKDGVAWIAMAAFDHKGPAERYCASCAAESSPWEYCVVEVDPSLQGGAEPGLLDYTTDDSGVLQPHDAWGGPHSLGETGGTFSARENLHRVLNECTIPSEPELSMAREAIERLDARETGGTDELVERLEYFGKHCLDQFNPHREAVLRAAAALTSLRAERDKLETAYGAACQAHEDLQFDTVAAQSSLAAEKLKVSELTAAAEHQMHHTEVVRANAAALEQRVAALVGQEEGWQPIEALPADETIVEVRFVRIERWNAVRFTKYCDEEAASWRATEA